MVAVRVKLRGLSDGVAGCEVEPARIRIPLAPARDERLSAAKGLLCGLALGAGSWIAILALLRFLEF